MIFSRFHQFSSTFKTGAHQTSCNTVVSPGLSRCQSQGSATWRRKGPFAELETVLFSDKHKLSVSTHHTAALYNQRQFGSSRHLIAFLTLVVYFCNWGEEGSFWNHFGSFDSVSVFLNFKWCRNVRTGITFPPHSFNHCFNLWSVWD